MHNLSTGTSLKKQNQSNTLVKLLLFEIGELTLALPILQIQKVVRQNELHGSGLSHVNLAHLKDREIAVVDLHQKLFGLSINEQTNNGYFIITKNIEKEPLGIAVSKAPSIVDVALEQIRLLPSSYRHADTLEIASHVTVISQGEINKTIFMLDLTKLV